MEPGDHGASERAIRIVERAKVLQPVVHAHCTARPERHDELSGARRYRGVVFDQRELRVLMHLRSGVGVSIAAAIPSATAAPRWLTAWARPLYVAQPSKRTTSSRHHSCQSDSARSCNVCI